MQKTEYELRISDWSSDVCSADLPDNSPRTRTRAKPSSTVRLIVADNWLTDSGGTLSPGTASANSRASVPSSDAGSGKGTDMNILLVGSGGREHALSWQLAQSPSCAKLYAAPANPGFEAYAECVGVAADDIAGLLAFESGRAH